MDNDTQKLDDRVTALEQQSFGPSPITHPLTVLNLQNFINGNQSGVVRSVTATGSGITTTPTSGSVVVANTGVTSLIAGAGVSISGSTGAITISTVPLPTTGIAFDASSSAQGVSTSITNNHTATGGSLVAFMTTVIQGGDWLTSITYSGLTPSLIAKVAIPATTGSAFLYSHALTGIPAGSANIITTSGTSTLILNSCETYTGAKQTGQPEAFAVGTGVALMTITKSVVTLTDKAWLYGSWGAGSNTNAAAVTAGSNTTLRKSLLQTNTDQWFLASSDPNAQETPTGSYSQTVNKTISDSMAIVVSSIAQG